MRPYTPTRTVAHHGAQKVARHGAQKVARHGARTVARVVLSLLYVCTRKLILNLLISLFVFYLDVALSIPHFFSFVSA